MLVEIILAICSILAFVFYKLTKNNDYFTKLGVPHNKPIFFFGNWKDVITGKKHQLQQFKEDYQQFRNEKLYGFYQMNDPMLVVNDPEIAKVILVKEFNNFVDRDNPHATKTIFGPSKMDKVMGNQLSTMVGEEWKNVRSTFSPIFTSGKMKAMMKFINHVSVDQVKAFDELHEKDEEFELKEVWGKFSMDSIASCAFGVDSESFTNPNSLFVKNAMEVFKLSIPKIVALQLVPGLYSVMQFFDIGVLPGKSIEFFVDIIKRTLQIRMESKSRRNDLIDMMIDAIKSEGMDLEESAHEENQYDKDMKLNHSNKIKKLDENVIIGTAMTLMVAGYDTTGMLLSYLGWEFAKSPEIQEKLQEEIDEAFEENNDKMPDYTTLQNLPYLDQVIHEGLRLHPPLLLTRHCINDFKIPGTDVILKKGKNVAINTWGIQMDPKYFPDPQKFNPENFSKEAKAERSPYTFLAFGQGPRACIGMRFALLEAKIGLVAVLRKFSFVRSPKTAEMVELDPASTLGYVKGGLWVKVQKREI